MSIFLKIIDNYIEEREQLIADLSKSLKERDAIIVRLAESYLRSKSYTCYRNRPEVGRYSLMHCDDCPLHKLSKELSVDLDIICNKYKDWSK